jgi:hypothetical protein
MTVQLTIVQLWALVAGGPIAMVLTVLVGILVNNAVGNAKADKRDGVLRAEIQRLEGIRKADSDRLEGVFKSELRRVEDGFKTELRRVEGVLSAKIDTLTARVKALEDEVRAPLVKRG